MRKKDKEGPKTIEEALSTIRETAASILKLHNDFLDKPFSSRACMDFMDIVATQTQVIEFMAAGALEKVGKV